MDISNKNQFHIKIGCHNIEGLNEKLSNTDFIEYLKTFHIYGFTETWRYAQNKIVLNDFQVTEKCKKRMGKRGRNPAGLAVFINSKISKYTKIINTDMDNLIWCLITLENTKILLGFIYNHPENSPYANKNYFADLEEEIIKQQMQTGVVNIILMGDLNSRIGNLNDCIAYDSCKNVPLPDDYLECPNLPDRINPDTHINAYGYKLIDFCKSNMLHVLNGRIVGDTPGNYTFVSQQGKSVIDYTLVSHSCSNLVKTFSVGDRVESHHFPIITELSIPYPKQPVHKQAICEQNHTHTLYVGSYGMKIRAKCSSPG